MSVPVKTKDVLKFSNPLAVDAVPLANLANLSCIKPGLSSFSSGSKLISISPVSYFSINSSSFSGSISLDLTSSNLNSGNLEFATS